MSELTQRAALVVEDQPEVRQIMALILEKQGIRVCQAGDVEEGLAVLAAEDALDLLVVDVGLPGATDGWSVVEEALSGRPSIRVLVVSGDPGEARPVFEKDTAALSFLPKPFSPSALVAIVTSLFERDT